MSAWMSEKPTTKSGFNLRISSIFADVNALTFGFSLRAMAGRTVKPLMPTMRCCSPSAYSTSVGSSVRQTIRRGPVILRSIPRQRLAEIDHPLGFLESAGRVRGMRPGIVEQRVGSQLTATAVMRPAFHCRRQGTADPTPAPVRGHVPTFEKADRRAPGAVD